MNDQELKPNKTYDAEEAAYHLKLCRRSLYKKLGNGELPRRKAGRQLVFFGHELISYLESITETNHRHNNKIEEIKSKWSKSVKALPTTMFDSSSMAKKLDAVLAHRTVAKPKNLSIA